MKRMRWLCLVMSMLLALSGCMAAAEAAFGEPCPSETEELPIDEAVEEVGALLVNEGGEEAPTTGGEAPTTGGETPIGEETPTIDGEDAPTEGEEPVALRTLTLPEKLVIGVKEQVQLRPEAEPAEAVYSLSFSGGGKAASVTEGGLLTGVKKGTGVVTVTADNGVTASVKVVVKAAPKSISIKAKKKWLQVGESTQLSCSLPKNTAGGCTFSAKKNDVLEVTPEGLVTALSPGVARVTATSYNGRTAAVKITVMGPFYVTFMSIGRNDGILIQCDGEYAFIDSGTHGRGVQAANFMKKRGVAHLKYYIASHGHKDHIGGAAAILAAIDTDEVIVNRSRTIGKLKSYAETSAEKKAAKKASYRAVKAGDTFSLGSAEFLVLGPVKELNVDPGKGGENGNSLILRLTYGETTFLLTGDATGGEISSVQKANPGCMQADVLKNPHHNGKQTYLVKLCKPKITVISTSKSDLPSSGYVSYIRRQGSKVYVTAGNRHGDVTIASDGKELTVTTEN